MKSLTVNVGKQYSRFPAGRKKQSGPASGEGFRDDVLVPLLEQHPDEIVVEFDDALGFGSSFLEEAFGGLVRVRGYSADDLLRIFKFVSEDLSLVDEVAFYITEAKRVMEGQR